MNKKIRFKTITLALTILLGFTQAWAQTPETVTCGNGKKYLASEIKQLVDFLNLPSQKKNETNAQALGYTVKITMNNVDEWGFGSGYSKGVYIGNDYNFEETDGIRYIRNLKIESSSDYQESVRLKGHLQIQNFKYLKYLSLENPYFGDQITVKGCPVLEEFRLESAESWGGNEEAPETERRLEIKNCPSLHTINISSLLTDFETDNFALENVSIRRTDMPCIDFSKQKQLKNLNLTGNKFAQITLPKRADYGSEMYEGDFSYNAVEPINWVPLIRAYYGDSLFYETDYNTGELIFNPEKKQYLGKVWNQIITVCDPITGSDSLSVGSKIDLSSLASLRYGVPAVNSKGVFNWYSNGQNVEGQYLGLTETPEMKKGIFTIPGNMRGTTITCAYSASPLLPDAFIKYIINVSRKPGKPANFVGNIPPVCEKDKKPKVEDKKEYWVVEVVASPDSGGSVSGGGTYEIGKSATLTAKENDGYVFRKWTLQTTEGSGMWAKTVETELGTDTTLVFSKPDDNKRAYKITGVFEEKPQEVLFYLALTCNLPTADLKGAGFHKEGTSVSVSVTAPSNKYEFKGWFEGDNLRSKNTAFTHTIESSAHLRAIYDIKDDEIKAPATSIDGQYVCTISFYDNKIPYNPDLKLDMQAMGVLELRTNNDLKSPYRDNNAGAISFDLGGKRHEVINTWKKENGVIRMIRETYKITKDSIWVEREFRIPGTNKMKQMAAYFAMTIFRITDKEIIAGAGGYVFGAEAREETHKEGDEDIFMRIRHIPYTRNADGSITLKDFDITGKNPEAACNITFYPVKNGALPIRWFSRPELYYEEKGNNVDSDLAGFAKEMKEVEMPKVLKELGIEE